MFFAGIRHLTYRFPEHLLSSDSGGDTYLFITQKISICFHLQLLTSEVNEAAGYHVNSPFTISLVPLSGAAPEWLPLHADGLGRCQGWQASCVLSIHRFAWT